LAILNESPALPCHQYESGKASGVVGVGLMMKPARHGAFPESYAVRLMIPDEKMILNTMSMSFSCIDETLKLSLSSCRSPHGLIQFSVRVKPYPKGGRND